MKKWLFLLVLPLVFLLFNCAAPVVPVTYDIQGTVKLWDGTPLSNVTVKAGTQQATTDSNGNWSITGLSVAVTVSAELDDYYIVVSGTVSPTKQVSSTSTINFTAYSETQDFAGGNGTQNDPYIIVTAQQLNNIRNNLDKHFKQIKNIDLNDLKNKLDPLVSNWEPVGHDFPVSPRPFTGSYDGMGFEIQNMVVLSDVDDYSGFFGVVSEANIRNIVFTNAHVEYDAFYSGIFAGYISDSLIDKVIIQGSFISKSTHVGGFAGFTSSSTITDCEVKNTQINASGDSSNYLGGFVADANATWFENCSVNDVDIIGPNSIEEVGGFAGSSNISGFKNCSFNGTIDATGTYIGGFAGYIEWYESEIGQMNFDSFEDCSVSGQIFARRNPSEMSGYVGGFAGSTISSLNFINCTVEMDIQVNFQSTKIGGFVAGISGEGEKFLRCSFEGSITANDEFMDIFGFGFTGTKASFEECFTRFHIQALNSAEISGFLGMTDGTDISMKNCYAKGTVSSGDGSTTAGFIVMNTIGEHPSVENCYSAVEDIDYGFVRNFSDTVVDTTNCFFDSSISGHTDDSNALRKTTTEMKSQNTYTNWDFDNVWTINSAINDGYPHLQWEN